MSERGLRILIADDEPNDRDLYRHYLKKLDIYGLNVKYTSNHDEALKAAKSFRPHIIFTDYTIRGSKLKEGGLSLIYLLRNEDFDPLFYVCSSTSRERLLKEIKDFSKDKDLGKIYPKIKNKIRQYIFKEDIKKENKGDVNFFKAFSIFISAIPRVLFIDNKSAFSRHKSEAEVILKEHDAVFEYESKLENVFERIKHFQRSPTAFADSCVPVGSIPQGRRSW
ncbi:MAG: response regulator [Candidatus Undinarchaeales archaeon]